MKPAFSFINSLLIFSQGEGAVTNLKVGKSSLKL